MTFWCRQCRTEGLRSRVNVPTEGTITSGEMLEYTDDAGQQHRHISRTLIEKWTCSQGHSWEETRIPPCPAEKCAWNDLDTESKIKSITCDVKVKGNKLQEKTPTTLNTLDTNT